jgi:hypothetical protein
MREMCLRVRNAPCLASSDRPHSGRNIMRVLDGARHARMGLGDFVHGAVRVDMGAPPGSGEASAGIIGVGERSLSSISEPTVIPFHPSLLAAGGFSSALPAWVCEMECAGSALALTRVRRPCCDCRKVIRALPFPVDSCLRRPGDWMMSDVRLAAGHPRPRRDESPHRPPSRSGALLPSTARAWIRALRTAGPSGPPGDH